MEKKIFYRVANNQTEQGLWYDFAGNFTGLIHSKFDFCLNTKLPMPFDKEITVTAIRQVLFFTKLAYRWCYVPFFINEFNLEIWRNIEQ